MSEKMKFAPLHDYFISCGGGEKVVLYLAKKYKPIIYTYFFEKEKTFPELKKFQITQSKCPVKISPFKQFFAINFFKKLDLKKKYDFFFLHGLHSVYAARFNHPNLWYCIGPSKRLYPEPFGRESKTKKFGVYIWRKIMTKKDQNIVKNYVDVIVTNSYYSAGRVKKYYKRNAIVIYPPVETKKFYNKSAGDFYLTVSRLEPNKRIELQIEAFKRMPDKKLIIVGEGSQKKYLENLAKNCKNIIFKGRVSEKELLELYAKCIAFIFTPVLEDFGLVSVEAMAAGKPVIAVKEGGVKEIILHNKTGLLINPNVKELIKAVKTITPEKAKSMKKSCVKRAKEFDVKVFYKKIDKIIKKTIKQFG